MLVYQRVAGIAHQVRLSLAAMLLASAKPVVGSRFVGWIERIYPPQITRVAIRY